MRTAYDAGIQEVILPVDNLDEALKLPEYITKGVKLTGVSRIQEVLEASLVEQ